MASPDDHWAGLDPAASPSSSHRIQSLGDCACGQGCCLCWGPPLPHPGPSQETILILLPPATHTVTPLSHSASAAVSLWPIKKPRRSAKEFFKLGKYLFSSTYPKPVGTEELLLRQVSLSAQSMCIPCGTARACVTAAYKRGSL